MWKICVVAVLALGAVACEPEPEWSSGGGGAIGGVTRKTATATAPLSGTSVEPLTGGWAAVADPDSDGVFIVKPAGTDRVKFPAGSRPMRVVEANGDLAVLLRGTGQLARVKKAAGDVQADSPQLTQVCPEPRGLAYDAPADAVVVACAGGELVTVTKTGRTVVETGLELRDVMLVADAQWVTTFRSAELLELTADGQVKTRLVPPPVQLAQVSFQPRVAWRAIAGGDRVVMVHQLHVVDEVTRLTNPGPSVPYYGQPYCTASVVSSALTVFDTKTRSIAWSRPIIGALPVDVAAAPDRIAVAFAGAGQVLEYAASGTAAPMAGSGGCLYPTTVAPGVPTGVGYVDGELEWFEQPGLLHRRGAETPDVQLVAARALEPSRQLFHAQSPSGVACASCHPEGFDDGHTWQFGTRRVRSQTLEGGLLATAPYHWDGRLRSVDAVLDETFVLRMGGAKADTSVVNELADWLDQLPARQLAQPSDAAAAKKGAFLFRRSGCDGCHAGEAYTNGTTVDVGTGGSYQVPSLRALRWRGPWLHNGCAQTLNQRFDPACGGERHGTVAPADVPDLVEFLKTL